jgi:hypothetical protein
MPEVQSFWSTVGGLVVLVVLVGGYLLFRRGAKPNVTPTPVPEPGEPAPAAPSYHGTLLLKPVYDEGERLIFQTTRQVAGCLEGAVTYGLDDNATGPYGVLVRAFRKDTLQAMPVYVHDGGPKCDGIFVPSGVFDVYLLAERPYAAVGSAVGCNVFVPYENKLVTYAPSMPKGCNPPQPNPGPAIPVVGTQVVVVIEVTPMNRFGATSGPYQQTVVVNLSTCNK